ncbi:putative transposase like protein [Trichonephila clavipes]|nr:putative transposase like protein [Trichonephila clavipes]
MKANRLNWAKQWRDKDVDFWISNKAQFSHRRRGEKFHSDCETPYKNDDLISHQRQGFLDVWTWLKLGLSNLFLAEKNIHMLDWPGNSPDMNPIENAWELMEREVVKDVNTNETLLSERIIHAWNHHPQMQETVQSCIVSMPRIIEALIAAKEGLTKY